MNNAQLAKFATTAQAIAQANPRAKGSCYSHICGVLDELEISYPEMAPSMIELHLGQAIADRMIGATLGDLPHQRGEIWRGLAFVKIIAECR